MNTTYFRPGLLALVIVPVLLGLACSKAPGEVPTPQTPAAQDTEATPAAGAKSGPKVVADKPVLEPVLPVSAHALKVLPVPFTSQAPDANWDALHGEACEEASMLMVAEYFTGNKSLRLTATYAEQHLQAIVSWEEKNGYTVDVTAQQVHDILRDYYSVGSRVVPYSAETLRKEILAGHPVILPAAGRLLGNPNFKTPGPLYHMLVVKGYEGNEFITNDPGTRKGENYRYDESVFLRAVHDWNGGDVNHGEQLMIVAGGLLN